MAPYKTKTDFVEEALLAKVTVADVSEISDTVYNAVFGVWGMRAVLKRLTRAQLKTVIRRQNVRDT
jgi:hypothetical protein